MCDMCPDDMSRIDTWQEDIKAIEQRLNYSRGEVVRWTRELEYTRKKFRDKLRKGELK